jgi:hypothetical protein
MQWSPAPQRCHGDPIFEYPRGGDFVLPRDSVPRYSGYAVYGAGVAGNLGVPGRLLKEYRRECDGSGGRSSKVGFLPLPYTMSPRCGRVYIG